MKVKTFEATGVVLDWLVAKCEGVKVEKIMGLSLWSSNNWEMYSTNWAQGGPIIEREGITVSRFNTYPDWEAIMHETDDNLLTIAVGPTPLIAAMRCYVTSKLGVEVEVPDELA